MLKYKIKQCPVCQDQVQLSIVIKHNEELRNKIALQLKNKTRFNDLFEELILKLNRGKVILVQIADQSKAVFKKRYVYFLCWIIGTSNWLNQSSMRLIIVLNCATYYISIYQL